MHSKYWLAMSLLGLVVPARAVLHAVAPTATTGARINLVGSHLKVTVGPQWIDVEEDAELQVMTKSGETAKAWLVEGDLNLPPRSLITGCLQWRGDSLLMGKLRGKATVHDTFTTIVSSDTAIWSSDPMLIEQKSESVYTLKLFPVAAKGMRRIRIRYLVPVTSRTGEVPILPLLSQVDGTLPPDWGLVLRGLDADLKLLRDNKVWSVTSPLETVLGFPVSGTVSLSWGANSTVGAPRAVADHITGGSWAGDFILFTGKLPDSIAQIAGIRSETAILWRWVRPESFLSTCYGSDPATGDFASFRCLTEYGDLALDQAKQISRIADYLTGTGNQVGLVADQGLDEGSTSFAMGDSGSVAFRKLKTWLGGINADYLKWRYPETIGSSDLGQSDLELSRNQMRFATDITQAGTLYSKTAGIIRHLLVVTVGPVPSGGEFQEPGDISGLPSGVSIASSSLTGEQLRYDATTDTYVPQGYLAANWPGVDLVNLQADHLGTQIVHNPQFGVRIPKVRNTVSATISIGGPAGDIPVFADLTKGADGAWLASVNIHSPGALGRVLKWKLSDENSGTLASWESRPNWVELVNDSVAPRLWAVSEHHYSRVFKGAGSLAPDFGFVDSRYSLLALPGDTLTQKRRTALVDSGVPFLGVGEIFAKEGYRDEVNPQVGIGPRSAPHRSALQLVVLASRQLRIGYAGLVPLGLEILDLRGRVVARWAASDLAGRLAVEWNGLDRSGVRVPAGLLVVRMRTTQGIRTGSVAMP